MRSRRQVRVKFLALALAGGVLFSFLGNCAILGGQEVQTSLNYTWFLTCETDTLFTGSGILVDCIGFTPNSTTTTTTTTTGTTGTTTDLSALGDLAGF